MDEYGEDIDLMSLEVTIPDDFPVFVGEVEYELFTYSLIPSEYIKYLKDE